MIDKALHHHDRSLRYVLFFVCLIHALTILLLYFQLAPLKEHKVKEKLIVTTVQLGVGERKSVSAATHIEKGAAQPIPETSKPISEAIEEEKKEEEVPPPPKKEEVIRKEPPKAKELSTKEKPKTPQGEVNKKQEKKGPNSSPKKEEKKSQPKKTEQKEKKKEKSPENKKKDTSAPKAKKAEPSPKTIDPEVEASRAAAKAKQQELLRNAKESIAKIDKTAHNITSNNSTKVSKGIPAPIERLEIEALPAGGSQEVFSIHEVGYREELIHRLKLLLRLPEYGEVKVKLTLERSGRVSKVVIVGAENATNRKYIEKTLPTLSFPSFGDNFSDQQNYTFLLTLSNE